MNLDRVFIKNEKLSYRIIDKEAIILNPKNSTYYSMNPSGTIIWKSIDGKRNVRELIDILKGKFNVRNKEPLEIEKDVSELIEELLNEGLIKILNNS